MSEKEKWRIRMFGYLAFSLGYLFCIPLLGAPAPLIAIPVFLFIVSFVVFQRRSFKDSPND